MIKSKTLWADTPTTTEHASRLKVIWHTELITFKRDFYNTRKQSDIQVIAWELYWGYFEPRLKDGKTLHSFTRIPRRVHDRIVRRARHKLVDKTFTLSDEVIHNASRYLQRRGIIFVKKRQGDGGYTAWWAVAAHLLVSEYIVDESKSEVEEAKAHIRWKDGVEQEVPLDVNRSRTHNIKLPRNDDAFQDWLDEIEERDFS